MPSGYGETAAYGEMPYKGEAYDSFNVLRLLLPDQVTALSSSESNEDD